jgi:predicted SAM-dependent methyltransferase
VSDAVRINLGSGHWKLDGWVNVDLDVASLPDVAADLARPLPFRDGAAALMHTEDFIDQLTLAGARAFLGECRRVLRPGGVLRVLTPDLAELARLYREDPERLEWLWNTHVGVPTRTGTAGEIFNLGLRFAGHTFVYDGETLAMLLGECGFEPRRVAFSESEVPALRGIDLRSPDNAVSMYWEGVRRG